MVRTAIGIYSWHACIKVIVIYNFVIIIKRAEIADVQTHLLCQVNGGTQSQAIAITNKRGIRLELVTDAIVGTLTSTTERQTVIDIILYASQKLMSAMSQLLLTVIGHLGILVIKEVVLQGCT
jgi:hypothetical protein